MSIILSYLLQFCILLNSVRASFTDCRRHLGPVYLYGNAASEDASRALYAAISDDSIYCMNLALEAGASMGVRDVLTGYGLIHVGVAERSWRTLRLLSEVYDSNLDPRATDRSLRTALHLAAMHGDTVRELIALKFAGGRMPGNLHDSLGRTPLHTAVAFGSLSAAQELVHLPRAPVNAPDYVGCTPVHTAASANRADMLLLLLSQARLPLAQINLADMNGGTPLHHAAFANAAAATHALLTAPRADRPKIDAQNARGETPLMVAVQRGSVDAATLLLAAGADTGVHDFTAMTPLHIAAAKNYVEVVQLLLENGADPCAPNADLALPLELAHAQSHTTLTEPTSHCAAFCAAGSHGRYGRSCIPCPRGHFCPGAFAQPVPCSQGYVQPFVGRASCWSCISSEYPADSAGRFVSEQAVRCVACQPDEHCTGATPAVWKFRATLDTRSRSGRILVWGTIMPCSIVGLVVLVWLILTALRGRKQCRRRGYRIVS